MPQNKRKIIQDSVGMYLINLIEGCRINCFDKPFFSRTSSTIFLLKWVGSRPKEFVKKKGCNEKCAFFV